MTAQGKHGNSGDLLKGKHYRCVSAEKADAYQDPSAPRAREVRKSG
jgi:hypothetical protein